MNFIKKIFIKNKYIPIDIFFSKVLYDQKFGYYNQKFPFGKKGDYITAPQISHLYNEIIAIWIISFWIKLGSPKKFNLIELGSGDASFLKVALNVFKNFKNFNKSLNIFIYEKNNRLKKIQKKNLKKYKITWLNNLNRINKNPSLFFGNEFFDSIPIKQFIFKSNKIYENSVYLKKNFPKSFFKEAKKNYIKIFRNLNIKLKKGLIEFPAMGLVILDKIIKILKDNQGGLLLIDYGYIKNNYKNTIQSLYRHKTNKVFDNLGMADITSLVNFTLLKDYLLKKKLKTNRIVSQSFFLQRMGIIERANILAKKQKFSEQSDLYYRLKRILDKKYMGKLFKVLFAYSSKKKITIGFK